MAVGAQRDLVCALFQHIAAGGAVAVVAVRDEGSELLFVDGQAHPFAAACGNDIRLGEGAQGRGRLFHAVFAVVIGIGRIEVQLHDLFARDVADVFHFYFHGELAALIFKREDRLLEIGIGQAVAEGIGHFAGDAHAALPVQLAVHKVLCADVVRRLIVAVADVHALFVFDIIADNLAAVIIHGGIFIIIVAVIGHHGVGEVVAGEDIHRPAGWIDLAAEDARQGIEALFAGKPRQDDGVRLQLPFHQGRELHGVDGVDDHHHFFAQFLRLGDHVLFVFGKGEVMGRAVGIAVKLQVHALRARAADKHDGGGRGHLRFLRGCQLVIAGDGKFGDAPVGAEAVVCNGLGTGRGFGLVGIFAERRIAVAGGNAVRRGRLQVCGIRNDVELRLQRLFGIDGIVVRMLHGTVRSGRIEEGEHIPFTEGRHRVAFCQRQHAVVFEEHHAFVGDVVQHLQRLLFRLFGCQRFAVIIGIPVFGTFDGDDVFFAAAERHIEIAAEHVCSHGDGDDDDEQHGDDRDDDHAEGAVAHAPFDGDAAAHVRQFARVYIERLFRPAADGQGDGKRQQDKEPGVEDRIDPRKHIRIPFARPGDDIRHADAEADNDKRQRHEQQNVVRDAVRPADTIEDRLFA